MNKILFKSSIILVLFFGLFAKNNLAFAQDKPELRTKINKTTELKKSQSPQSKLNLMRIYINSSRFFEAAELANDVISADKDNPELYLLLTELYIGTGQLDNAEKAVRTFHKLDPKNIDAYPLLGQVYLEKAIKQNDKTQKALYLRKSFKSYRVLYLQEPDDPRAYVGLGRIYYQRGDFSKALSHFMIAKEFEADNPDTLFYIGEYHTKQQNYDKAIKYLNLTVKYSKKPRYETHLMLGGLYEKLAEVQKAKNEYKKALNIKPGDNTSLERYRAIENL